MKQSVRESFLNFTSPLEGVVPWMYLDVKGLVTTAIGNLIDPVSAAVVLPFVHPGGAPASGAEIEAAWRAVKGHKELAQQGHRPAARVSNLRLTDEGVERVVFRKLDEFDAYLTRRFPGYQDWPADAQLATLSMSWACGPAFHFMALEASLKRSDFATAAEQCHINDVGNPGLKPRNILNRQLYLNAAKVRDWRLDPESLVWPAQIEDLAPGEVIDLAADHLDDEEPPSAA